MGASTSNAVQTSTVRQTSINDFYQESRSECLAFVNQAMENITVYVGPGASIGALNFSQKAEQNASCMLNTNLESLSTNKLESMQAQLSEQSSGGGRGFFGAVLGVGVDVRNTVQTTVTEQTMKNMITQLVTSSCGATTNQLLSNITVYLAEGATADDVNFTQDAPQNLNCTIMNTSTLEAYNEATASQDQVTKQTLGLLEYLLIAAVAVVALALIAMLAKRKDKTEEEELPVEPEQKPVDNADFFNNF